MATQLGRGTVVTNFLRLSPEGATKDALDERLQALGFEPLGYHAYARRHRDVLGMSPPTPPPETEAAVTEPDAPEPDPEGPRVLARMPADESFPLADLLAVAVLRARIGPEQLRRYLAMIEAEELAQAGG